MSSLSRQTSKRILHISDLHFGRVNQLALEALKQMILEQEKGFDLIIMTGDWTQRARAKEFEQAAQFIRELSCPVLSVPGNHDVPLFDLGRRFLAPYSRYLKLRPLTMSHFQDADVSIVGLSTVHPYRPFSLAAAMTGAGFVHTREVERARDAFSESPSGALRIVACHHPLFHPRTGEWLKPEDRAQGILDLRPHLILSGHSHAQWVELRDYHGEGILHISAGTSISSRIRDEVNSFHILEIERNATETKSKIDVIVKTYDLSEDGFLERGMPTRAFVFDIAHSG